MEKKKSFLQLRSHLEDLNKDLTFRRCIPSQERVCAMEEKLAFVGESIQQLYENSHVLPQNLQNVWKDLKVLAN